MGEYTIEAPDKTRERKFLYKKDEKPVIVYMEDVEKKYEEGWCDSPAEFFDMKAHGVEKGKEGELKDVIKGLKDISNDEINLEAMNAKKLKAFVRKTFPGLEYHKNATKKQMLELIKTTREAIKKEEEEFINKDINVNSSEDTGQSIH